ncbi:uncharacterized protein DS421_8g241350 [Arachis hypogaea]|nr:uncharacterized protein DS421_8g241350 [Arachis hypogaea]
MRPQNQPLQNPVLYKMQDVRYLAEAFWELLTTKIFCILGLYFGYVYICSYLLSPLLMYIMLYPS